MPAKSVKFDRLAVGFPRSRDSDLQGVYLLSHSLEQPASWRGCDNLGPWISASQPCARRRRRQTPGRTSFAPEPTNCLPWQTRNNAEPISFEGLLSYCWNRRASSTKSAAALHNCAWLSPQPTPSGKSDYRVPGIPCRQWACKGSGVGIQEQLSPASSPAEGSPGRIPPIA